MNEKLEKLIQSINKKHGAGNVFRLGDRRVDKISVIPTGIIGLDHALGVGGFPKSRITEIYGPEASGKTGIALSTIAEAQKLGMSVWFIDAEYALDINFCNRLGVDVDSLLISQPDTLEDAFTLIAKQLTEDPSSVDLIVVDSLDALETKREADSELGESNVGIKAKVNSQIFRRFAKVVGKSTCALVIINQIRDKMNTVGYGDTTTTTGGRALKFYASVRVDVKKIGLVKDDDKKTEGQKIKVHIVKNKVASPYKEYEYEVDFLGFDTRLNEVFNFAVQAEIIKKAGSWFSYKETKLQGDVKMKEYIVNNNLQKELEEQVRGWLGLL